MNIFRSSRNKFATARGTSLAPAVCDGRRDKPLLLRIIAAIAVVLVGASFGIVGGSPAFASNVGSVTFAGSSPTTGAVASWTVGFTTAGQGALGPNGTITAKFPSAFTMPTNPVVTLGNAAVFKCSATAAASGGTVTVTLGNSGGTCAIPKNNPVTLAIGGITNPAAATYAASNFTVATSSETSPIPVSSPIIIEGPPAQLAFFQQPVGAVGGAALTTQPKVIVRDGNGNTVTTDVSTVTLSIATSTPVSGGPGTLSGCSQSEASGVITFSGCRINTVGTGYKLHAVDASLTAPDSTAFNVTVGPAAQLAFAVTPQPTGTAGSPVTSLQAFVQDAGGNTITAGTGSTDTITLAIATGPAGGTFNSVSTTYTNVAASSGVATFTGVVFNTAGSYTLTASDTTPGDTGFTTATSSAIVISAAAANKLVYVQGPSDASAGSVISPAITVQVQDQYGNAVAGAGVGVTLGLTAGAIDSGASATTNGVGRATFSGVIINTAAAGLTLTASATGLTATPASAPFNVTVAVSNGAVLTDTASDGAGSGVNTVGYFRCSGYSGSCTSANWTPIGSSTSSSGSYLVTWTGQPANGPYRLVVVGTDNLINASQPSASIPVTVTN
jgi:hypothetical protein